MELRYLGFDQSQNSRTYRFDRVAKTGATGTFLVTVDLTLFRTHHVALQEGPSLCARKLAADLETSPEGAHVLTTEDIKAFADARTAAEQRKAESRQGGRHAALPSPVQSPWRNSGV
jgi:hypothetical protein